MPDRDVDANRIVICLGGAAAEIGNVIVERMTEEGEIKKEKNEITGEIERWNKAAIEEKRKLDETLNREKIKKIDDVINNLYKIEGNLAKSGVNYFDVKDDIEKCIEQFISLGIKPEKKIISGIDEREIKKEEEKLMEKGVSVIAIDSNPAPPNLNPSIFHLEIPVPDRSVCEQSLGTALDREYWPSESGAGMRRLVGKVYFELNKSMIFETITKRAEKLKEKTGRNNFLVVVITAFGGGTGSGIFLDLSMKIKEELPGKAKLASLMVVGVATLPLPHEAQQLANTYAALKESHFMLSSEKKPFNALFIADRKELGDNPRAYERFTPAIADFIRYLNFVPQETVKGTGKKGPFDLADFGTYTTGVHTFSTFSYYRVVFPFRKLKWFYKLSETLEKQKKDMENQKIEYERLKIGIEEDEEKLLKIKEEIKIKEENLDKTKKTLFAKLTQAEIRLKEKEIEREKNEKKKIEDEISVIKERRIPDFEKKLGELKKEIEKTEIVKSTAIRELNNGTSTLRTRTIDLNNSEIEKLRNYDFEEGNFRDVMEFIGRVNEYEDLTHSPVKNSTALFNPLLDYVHAVTTSEGLSPEERRELTSYKLLKVDEGNRPIMTTSKSNFFLSLISSDPRNIVEERMQINSLKEKAEDYVAIKAENRFLSAPSPYEVMIYGVLFGISLSPVAPGKPYRLRNLKDFENVYNKESYQNRIQYHALFFINYNTFKELTGKEVVIYDLRKTNEEILKFWENYQMASDEEKLLQVPTILAMIRVYENDLKGKIQKLSANIKKFEEDTSPEKLSKISKTDLPRISGQLGNLCDLLEETSSYIDGMNSGVMKMVDNLEVLSCQLKNLKKSSKSIGSTISVDVFKNICKMAEETSIKGSNEEADNINKKLESESLKIALIQARDAIGAVKGEDMSTKRYKGSSFAFLEKIEKLYGELKVKVEQLEMNLFAVEDVELNDIKRNIKEIKSSGESEATPQKPQKSSGEGSGGYSPGPVNY